jgi:hypothetical protein
VHKQAAVTAGRQLVRNSFDLSVYEPGSRSGWDEAYARVSVTDDVTAAHLLKFDFVAHCQQIPKLDDIKINKSSLTY